MRVDVAIVGAGAAGLATALFIARWNRARSIVVLDGAKKLGAKILVSGGGRCNVTNTKVTPADYWGGSSHTVRRVLGALGVEKTVAFFREIGVPLHEEPGGKLFPDSNRARTVLDALLGEADRLGVKILTGRRISEIRPGFHLDEFEARRVVLATGGLSLPKTGSDGGGYALARSLGHSIVPTTPALAPLVLEGDFHAPLSGVSHEVEISVGPARFRGSMLWTHFGISGPAALDASRHWHRAQIEGRPATVTANLIPGRDADRLLLSSKPGLALRNALAEFLPARVADAVLARLKIDGAVRLAQLPRETRRTLAKALARWPLPVRDSQGYNYAEVTAGGVPLGEIDPSTMQSRKCRGLYLVGEILDVDGRIGGFNFQWSWSSAWVAAKALASPWE